MEDLRIGNNASRRDIQWIKSAYLLVMYCAYVSVREHATVTSYIEVSIDVDRQICECPCCYYNKFGIYCVHAKAVLLQVGQYGMDSIDWINSRYHLETYLASYGAEIPGMAVTGKLNADPTFAPPDHKWTAGCPAKKRLDWSYSILERRQLKEFVTLVVSWEILQLDVLLLRSTQYHFEKHKDRAVKWCRQHHESVAIDD